MSSSWSEIRSRSSDDPLLDTIADLQNRANQSEAVTDIASTDKIPPIRIIKSRLEFSDRKMMTGYVRARNSNQTYQMPKEPDNDHLRLDIKFDSGFDTLSDYSLMGNKVNVGFTDTLPILTKGTEDDGITTGDIVSVLDGKTHHYRIPINPAISVKQMVLDGKPGISIIYRQYPLIVKNEEKSGNTQRAVAFSMIENDQVEYAIKAEIDDAGYLYYFFRYQFINYYVKTVNSVIPPPIISDYFAPDYTPTDYDAAEEYYNIEFPTPYIDLAFLFNFSTKGISIFINGVQTPITITGINLVPALPAPIFPPAFADPPPPPEQPLPYLQPFQEVYKQISETGSVKVNAVTTTEQLSFYAVPPAEAVTEPLDLVYNVPIGITTTQTNPDDEEDDGTFNTVDPIPFIGQAIINDATAPTESGYELLFDLTSSDNSRAVLSDGGSGNNHIIANQFVDNSAGMGKACIGKVAHRVLIEYNSESSPTGLAFVRMWDSTGKVVHTYGQVDTSTIKPSTSGYEAHAFWDNSVTAAIQEGYRIGIEYTTGASSDIVNVRRRSNSVDDSVAQAGVKNDENPIDDDWHVNTSFNLRMALYRYTGAGTPEPASTLVYNLTETETRTIVPIQIKQPDGSYSAPIKFNFDTGASSPTDLPLECLAAFGYGPDGVGTDSTKRVQIPTTIKIVGLSGEYTINLYAQDKDHYDLLRSQPPPTRYPLLRLRDLTDRISMVFGKFSTIFRVGSTAPTEYTNAPSDQVINFPDMKSRAGTPTTGWQWNQVKFTNPSDSTKTFTDWFGLNTGDRRIIMKKSVADAITLTLSPVDSENWDSNVKLEFIETSPTHAIIPTTAVDVRIDTADFARGGPARNFGGGPPVYELYTIVIWGGTKWALVPPQTNGTPSTGGTDAGFQGPVQKLGNTPGSRTFAGEWFGPTSTIVNSIPTSMEFMIWRSAETTAGTVSIKHYSSQSTPTVVTKPPILVPTSNRSMKPYGGPTWSGATFHFIFAGADWNTVTTPYSRQNMIDKIHLLFESKYFDYLIQYDVKRPKLGEIVTNTTFTLPTSFTTTNLNDLVQDSITRGQVPDRSNDVKHAYMVFTYSDKFPAGGSAGYHTVRVNPANHLDKPLVTGMTTYKISLGSATNTLSHEIVEMLTDPILFSQPPTLGETGIYGDPTLFPLIPSAVGYEICDVCEVDPGPSVNGVNVEPYYSNQDNGCIAPSISPPWLSCPTGSTWDDEKQTCLSTVSVNSPQLKKTLLQIPAISLPTSQPSLFNVVWQDTDNLVPIAANDVIGIEVSGVTTGSIKTMNNLGNGGTVGVGLPGGSPDWSSQANYDQIIYQEVPDPGTPIVLSSSTYDAIAFKFDSATASAAGVELLDKIVHRVTVQAKNEQATTVPVRWYILDALNQELFKSGPNSNLTATPDTALIDYNQYNPDQKVKMQVGYKIVIEFKTTVTGDSLSIKTSNTNIDSSFSTSVRGIDGNWTDLPATDIHIRLWQKKANPVVYVAGSGGLESPVALGPPLTLGMKNYGGPVYSKAIVHLIFNGFDWDSRLTPFSRDQVKNKIKAVLDSKYFDALIQYDIKRPVIGKIVDRRPNPELPNSYTGADITADIQKIIDQGVLPAPSADINNIYLVFTPFGKAHATNATGGTALNDVTSPTPIVACYVPYLSTLDLVTTHAIRVLMTCIANPYSSKASTPTQGVHGWVGDPTVLTTPTTLNNIATYCLGLNPNPVIVGGTAVPKYYSNQDGGCQASGETPSWIKCQTGSVYEEKKQVCVSLTIPAPTTGGGGTGGGGAGGTGTVNLTPIIPAPKTLGMKDYGGPKLTNAMIHMIYWGPTWNTQKENDPWSRAQMDSGIITLIQSHYFDTLIQYGIKRPKWSPSIVYTDAPCNNGYTDVQLYAVITDAIAKKLVPGPHDGGVQHGYFVVAEPGKRPGKSMGANVALGWHTALWDEVIKTWGVVVSWIGYFPNFYDVLFTITHEICEALTDPVPAEGKLGIYTNDKGPLDINFHYGAEISDICLGFGGGDYHVADGHIGPYVTNGYYSNHDGGCVGDNIKATWMGCHIGAKWDDAKQECVPSTISSALVGGTVGQTGHDYDGTNSYYVTKKASGPSFVVDYNTVDLSARITRGGNIFTGYVELNDVRKRTGIKANTELSVIIGQILTKVEMLFKKVGSPPNDLITCCIRNQAGFQKVIIGTVDSATILDTNTPVTFINTQNNIAFAEGDTLSIEYDKGNATNFIQVRTSNGFFNSSDAGNTVLFESSATTINSAVPMFRRDLAATLYSGGKTDLTARPLRGVMVNSVNSVLYDKAITEVRLKLRGFGILPLGNTLRVKIIRGSDKVTQAILGELDMNSIQTDFATEYYFQNTDNKYAMKVGDMVALEFNHGDPSHFIELKTSVSDFYDGQNTVMFESNGKTYTPVTDRDMSGTMSIGGFTVVPDPISIPPTPPFHYAHEWIIGALSPEDTGALSDPALKNPPVNSYYNNISKQFRIYDFLLTPNQLQNYFENRFTITPIPKGRVEIVGHDIVPIEATTTLPTSG